MRALGVVLMACGVLSSVQAGAADLVRGKTLYQRHCVSCHGISGLSVLPDTPNLALNQGLTKSDLQIVQDLKVGGPRKPPFIGLMTDSELLDVVAYIRTIR